MSHFMAFEELQMSQLCQLVNKPYENHLQRLPKALCIDQSTKDEPMETYKKVIKQSKMQNLQLKIKMIYNKD